MLEKIENIMPKEPMLCQFLIGKIQLNVDEVWLAVKETNMCQFLIGKVQQAYPADNSEDLEEEDGVNSS